MRETYTKQLILENRKNDLEATDWLHCFMTNTPPSYEDCANFLSAKDLKLSKALYKKVFKERGYPIKKPLSGPKGH